jgi:hypothetical protein
MNTAGLAGEEAEGARAASMRDRKAAAAARALSDRWHAAYLEAVGSGLVPTGFARVGGGGGGGVDAAAVEATVAKATAAATHAARHELGKATAAAAALQRRVGELTAQLVRPPLLWPRTHARTRPRTSHIYTHTSALLKSAHATHGGHSGSLTGPGWRTHARACLT